jgi:hypothetical protein
VKQLIILAVALIAVSAHADDITKDKRVVKAYSDGVAALMCARKGYRYMMRLGTAYVMCLETNKGTHVNEVRDIAEFMKSPQWVQP